MMKEPLVKSQGSSFFDNVKTTYFYKKYCSFVKFANLNSIL